MDVTNSDEQTQEWLSPPELSEEWQIPERTLSQWRHLGKGPRYYRFGRHVRYRRSDVLAWADAQAVTS